MKLTEDQERFLLFLAIILYIITCIVSKTFFIFFFVFPFIFLCYYGLIKHYESENRLKFLQKEKELERTQIREEIEDKLLLFLREKIND